MRHGIIWSWLTGLDSPPTTSLYRWNKKLKYGIIIKNLSIIPVTRDREDAMKFRQIGYYIVEEIPTPDFLSLPCRRLLSVSGCIGSIHPDLMSCLWEHPASAQQGYRNKLHLSSDKFLLLQAEVRNLFDAKRLEMDSRFIRFEDAKQIMQEYFKYIGNLKVIGIATNEMYLGIPQNKAFSIHTSLPSDRDIRGTYLGCDILGWDPACGVFHSYLCNGLEREIEKKFAWEIDERGVIQNEWKQVVQYAKSIAGLGEPVVWTPFLLHDCTEL